MNFKAMNTKKGLKRFWIVGSVFWLLYPFIPPSGNVFGNYLSEVSDAIIYFLSSQIIWWGLLYVGFWVARGFVDDKKAGF